VRYIIIYGTIREIGANKLIFQFRIFTDKIKRLIKKMNSTPITTYWVVRKVCANFEGKLKRRRFKFLISFIKFKSFAA